MHRRNPQTLASGADRERGVSLILVLAFGFFITLLGTSLLFLTGVEYRSSTNHTDSVLARNDLDSAVAEVVYRLNLRPAASAPPTGSQISVNDLSNFDAAINPDPWNLLGNGADDDGDTDIDEPDELNLNREWTARITLTKTDPAPGSPYEVVDLLPLAGPDFGSKLVLPTIQPATTWREYSTAAWDSPDVLTLRFKLDTDTVIGDSEGDGPEIVFYDPSLARNSFDDKTTLTGLGGDSNAANDSPYNITFVDGLGVKHPATGSPVLLISATSKVRRGGKVAAQQSLEGEILYPLRPAFSKAICGCTNVDMGSSNMTNSYSSALGPYGGGNIGQQGNVGANGNIYCSGTISGDAEAGGLITGADAILRDAVAGGTITGTPGHVSYPNTLPIPQPCDCTVINVTDEVDAAEDDNDNATAIGPCAGSFMNLNGGDTCTLNCGTYYYDRIKITGGGSIVVGDVSCGPVKIYVRDQIDIGGNGIVNANKPADLQIIASVPPPNLIDMGGSSNFNGVIYAPLSDIRLHGGPDLYGAVLGKTVDGNGGPNVHYDETLAGLFLTRAPYRLLAWNEN